jgi:hypothetical protein
MIRVKDHKQLELFDPWGFLSPKRRRMLDEGWPGLFRSELLSEMPVNEMYPFFREDFGRPSKELYTLLGVLLLQQTMDLPDEEAIEQLAFNTQWHYALNITEESDSAKYISEKTLWSWRQVLIENNLDQLLFRRIGDKLAKVFNVNTENQRIDSVHIKSNMRRLGRIGIFTRTINRFLVNLKRHHRPLFDTVAEEVLDRYASRKALAAFSMVKPSGAEKTLKRVSGDLFDLIEQFKDHSKACQMHSYKLMQRVLSEQCNVNAGAEGGKVSVKKPKEISSASLQNPSDPDATYSGHKGQGYQVQVKETFTKTENRDEKNQTLNLVTHVSVEQACAHDSGAIAPAIEDTQSRQLGPSTLLADTHYGSDDNVVSAEASQVELIATTAKGATSNPFELSQFNFDQKARVTSCPQGHVPETVKHKKKKDRFSACFNMESCGGCAHVERCPVKRGKKHYYLRYTSKEYRLARRRAMESTDDFIDAYRWRAGVEATMNEYNTLTGVKRLRVRGSKAVRYCATLKAAGLNLLRAARVRSARIHAERARNGSASPFSSPFSIIKELFWGFFSHLGKLTGAQPGQADCYRQSAA